MSDDGFKQIASNPVVLALMQQIEQNVVDNEQHHGPRTFVCFACCDMGVTIETHKSRLGDTAQHLKPCLQCEEGETQERGWATFKIKQSKQGRERNRLLSHGK